MGACGVTGCDSRRRCCGDTPEQALTVADRRVCGRGKLGFCLLCPPDGRVSLLLEISEQQRIPGL